MRDITYHFWQESLLVHVLGCDVLAHGSSCTFQHEQAIRDGTLAELQPLLLCITQEKLVKQKAMQNPVRRCSFLAAAVSQLLSGDVPKVSALASAVRGLSAWLLALSTVLGDALPSSGLDSLVGEPALSGARPLLCCKAGCCSGEGA